jgi:hypothetical protein
MRSQETLEKMSELWRSTGTNYREGMLEVGRMIHLFILQRLEEGDQMGEDKRRKLGITRELCLMTVTQRLGCDRHKTNSLLSTAMAVDLLSGGCPLGEVAYSTVREFKSLVKRVNTGQKRRRKKEQGNRNSSGIEDWDVNPLYKDWARRLFKKAVKEEWGCKKTRRVIQEKTEGMSPKAHRKETKEIEGEFFDPMHAMRNASVQDAAEMIVTMIRYSQDPGTLKCLLKTKLDTI